MGGTYILAKRSRKANERLGARNDHEDVAR